MRRHTATWTCLVVVAVGFAATSAAQESSLTSTTRSLAARQRWVRFVIVGGRIMALAGHGQNNTRSTGFNDDEYGESFAVRSSATATTVSYEVRDVQQSVRFQFVGRDSLEMERVAYGGSSLPRLRFRQKPGEDLVLVLGEGAGDYELRARTLWHLLLAAPQPCRDELTGLLAKLRPDWDLNEQAAKIEAALLAWEKTDPRPPVEQLVEQLGDRRFAVRQKADRQLRQYGHSLLPVLDQLDASRFNTEQRQRIAELRESLHVLAEDSVPTVTAWLANDLSLWQSWAQDGATDRQLVARRQLDWFNAASPVAGQLARGVATATQR